MKEQVFMLKIGDDRQEKVTSLEDLGTILEEKSENLELGQLAQVLLSNQAGDIFYLSPSDYDSRLRWWDASTRRPIDLWRILQNFLHIRTSEHHEKPYIPADPDLGRVSSDFIQSSF